MLSGDDCEKEAWRAGVDAFLRKPEAIDQVSSTITRVLKEREEKSD
jgi:DNA-binding NtrC family response regulator